MTKLVTYMLQPEKSEVHEKVLYSGFGGFISEDILGAQAEMAAMADGAKTSSNSVIHLVMSWKEGEQPGPQEVDKAVAMLMKELRLTGHGVIYSLHLDTDNLHLHIAICRVHPQTEKVVSANSGFDLEAIHKAIARIEHAQGWQPEVRRRYAILDDGQLVRCGHDGSVTRAPAQGAKDMEQRTGEKSAQRLAIEIAAPEILSAATWEELHRKLALHGMRYEKKGSGAVIFVGDRAVKASTADRRASLTQLQKRLGPYMASEHNAMLTTQLTPEGRQVSQALDPRANGWDLYIESRREYFRARELAQRQLRKELDANRRLLWTQQRAERHKVLGGNWTQMGMARTAIRSVLAAQHAGQRAALQQRHTALRDALQAKFKGGFPDFESWLRLEIGAEAADAWRYRLSVWACLVRVDAEEDAQRDAQDESPAPSDIRAFKALVMGRDVYYYNKATQGQQTVGFIDRSQHIEVVAMGEEAILGAMQLAMARWGKFAVEGSDAFKARCVEIAALNRIALDGNPELKESLAAENKRMRQAIQRTEGWPEVMEWGRYFQAMQAPRYSITVSHSRGKAEPALERMTWGTGEKIGLTVAEIVQAKMRMSLGEQEGDAGEANWAMTPLFVDRMALRICDASRAQLDALSADGISPRLVLQTGHDHFDVLVTAPSAGMEHAQEAAMRWLQSLQIRHGLKSEVCGANSVGHLLPGYASTRFPAHTVRVYRDFGGDCARTQQMLQAFDHAVTQELMLAMDKQEHRSDFSDARWAGFQLSDIFALHYRDIDRLMQGERMHPSRKDALVCLRMRMTGHARDDVAAALVKSKMAQTRESEPADWSFYAKRATDFAWGPAGRRQEEILMVQLERWHTLEMGGGASAPLTWARP